MYSGCVCLFSFFFLLLCFFGSIPSERCDISTFQFVCLSLLLRLCVKGYFVQCVWSSWINLFDLVISFDFQWKRHNGEPCIGRCKKGWNFVLIRKKNKKMLFSIKNSLFFQFSCRSFFFSVVVYFAARQSGIWLVGIFLPLKTAQFSVL